ncbi:MAG: tetratricopeptide repeat protein [Acidimicrobiia bacterium]|nr:tetratricopeptide repeat protein [Acidimicrobiia bacterium]
MLTPKLGSTAHSSMPHTGLTSTSAWRCRRWVSTTPLESFSKAQSVRLFSPATTTPGHPFPEVSSWSRNGECTSCDKPHPKTGASSPGRSTTSPSGFLRWDAAREALQPATQAANLYRTLAEQNPAAYNPDLASALNNLAVRLSGVGRRDEALQPATEAVQLRRKLAEQNPAAYNP